MALVLSVGTVYGMGTWATPRQGVYPSGMMGGYGYGAGSTGSPSTYWGGMMGGYGGMMSGYGGYGGYGGLMAGYGGMTGQYPQRTASGWSNMWNRTASGTFVAVVNNGFYPTTLTIPKGTTVTWVNMDFVQHTVTSGSEQAPTNLFDSHELNHMQSFSYTFNTPGTFAYYCDVHPDMVGTIIVS